MNKPNISSRKRARRLAMQALYGWHLSENNVNDIENFYLRQHLEEAFDREYFHHLLINISAKVNCIDNFMKPYLNRKIEELDYIELSILRLAIYELQYQPDLPFKVIINEALELAKGFGAKDSYKFINGVLDKISKDVRKEGPL